MADDTDQPTDPPTPSSRRGRGGSDGDHPVGHRRLRGVAAWALLVVAGLLAVLSVLVVFVRNEVLDTDTYVSTVAPLSSDPAVQDAVAYQVSTALVHGTDLQGRIEHLLPKKAAPLAAPIASAVGTTVQNVTHSVVASPQFGRFWEQANRKAHATVVTVLTGGSVGPLTTDHGTIAVDLTGLEQKVQAKLAAKGITFLSGPLSRAPARLVLLHSSQLASVQGLIRLLNKLAVVLPVASLLLYAVAVLLHRDRRRGLVRAAAGLTASMAVLLVVMGVVRNQYLGTLAPGRARDAGSAVVDDLLARPLDSARTVLVVALVVTVVAWAAGNATVRRWVSRRGRPSWLTAGPVHEVLAGHRVALQWGTAGLGLAVLAVWDQPTAFVAVLVTVVTLAVVALVGVLGAGPAGSPSADPA